MPIKPEQSDIVINGQALFVNSIRVSSDVSFFTRPEFSNARLRNAPNDDGTVPVITTLPGGVPIQLSDNCTTAAVRPLDPDTDAERLLIYRRFDIRRWQLDGAPSAPANVDSVLTTHFTHKAAYAVYENHKQMVGGDLSYNQLMAMRLLTFFASGGVSISGTAVGSWSDVFIAEFLTDVEYEDADGILKGWSAVLEQRTEKAGSDPVF